MSDRVDLNQRLLRIGRPIHIGASSEIAVRLSCSSGLASVVALVIDEDDSAERVADDDHQFGLEQRVSVDGSVLMVADLARLDRRFRRLVIGCELNEARVRTVVTADVCNSAGDLIASSPTEVNPHVRAIGVLELSRERDSWVCRGLSTTYQHGIDALLADYGIDADRPMDLPVLDDDAPRARAGQMVNQRYELQRMLGSGAMGDVWLALDHILQRRVAVKHFRGRQATSKRSHDRMMREARLAAQIEHHHAVMVYDLVVDGGVVPYLVMQFVEGQSLAELIDGRSLFPLAEAAEVARQVASALTVAHAHGIVHRDIKPANILLNARSEAKLGDFGIAQSVGDASLTQSGYLIGTPAFLAPEVARGGTADHRSDVYALGATLWNVIEGVAPFMHDRPNSLAVLARILSEPFPASSRAGNLASLLAAMTDPEPDQRPTAVEVEAALAAATTTASTREPDGVGAVHPLPTLSDVSRTPPTEIGGAAPPPVASDGT